ncbi:hypothetical protein [Gorillibacterium massiliense]|uniref:hypothetical protein n=1 Tax=Gorillibacterium massiliense TaxID=1280390 RepID=UPI0004BC1776|nr:hypothetical protein [Gorillibacterium massiliense]
MAMNAIDLSRPPVPTAAEKHLVKQYVLLPVLLTILQRDMDAIGQSSLRISLPHIQVIQRMMDSIKEDLIRVRQSLGRAGIRIYTEKKNANGVTCKFICRGYHETVALSREDTRSEVSRMANKYAGTPSSSAS